jgi:2-polyprenyl-3-methyl-5-hydroxy-6-metoxy-1,4-benzoquinol methylase
MHAETNADLKTKQTLEPLVTYFQLMTMNGGAFVFHVATQFGFLKILASAPLSLGEICANLKTQERPSLLVLKALQGMGLIEEVDLRYRLTAAAQFLSGSYEALGQEYWNHLPQLLKTGEPLKRMETQDGGEAEYRKQVQGLEWMMTPSAKAAVAALGIGQRRKNLNILDLGAGSGIWSLEMLKVDPGSQATLVDWPGVLPVAQQMAAIKSLTSRVQLISGDYHRLDFKEGAYDLVILGNITHLEGKKPLLDLLKRVKPALSERGEVVIFDVSSQQKSGALSASLYEVGLALRTSAGEVHSEQALQAALEATGFAPTPMLALPVPPYTMGMMVASLQGN